MVKTKKYINSNFLFTQSIDSTNNYIAKGLKEGTIESGTVIMAGFQTKGRGQRGKVWQSDASKNIMISIGGDLNRWKIRNIVSLNHIVSIGIFHCLSKYVKDIAIKWPNDILVSDKKICGILIETQWSSTKWNAVIGIGLNVNQESFENERATSLKLLTEMSLKMEELVVELINELNDSISLYHRVGELEMLQLFNAKLWKRGQKHFFYLEEKAMEGVVQETNLKGELIVNFGEEMRVFKNGEVRY